MKMKTPALLALSAVFSLLVALARADETAHAKILRERDGVLSQIVAEQEARFTTGTMDEEGVMSARLALWTFRRDTATTPAVKIKHQEMIVGLHEKRLATLQGRAKAGVVGHVAVLLATDELLQAQQELEEFRLSAPKG